ncbi:carbonic anhydrase [Pseudoroseomonas deserti]|uniref:carbonic anhydrase n=1 Tax=Teichococcus deserti TaxID=1817963 RepID=A0A1V2H449_9PROT|nr:carbonic anhydrase [Pseudoroseomonas deserti]ONG55785.1 carbonic anhydrase [Pseudoroseomonas deserti]
MSAAPCRCCSGLAPRQGRRALLGGALALAASAGLARAADPVPHSALTPDQALALLKQGNDEFRAEAPYHAAIGRERRVELARGQAPFCVLVGCSDSRVSPELLFGRGLGELFIVRNAGNTVDTAALGSIEYGVGVLGCPLIVVLGHENCGAVAAALDVVQNNARFPGVIGEMVQPILPAVLSVRQPTGAIALDEAVIANARRVALRLRTQSPVIQGLLGQGRVKVVAARYDLDDGDVAWFEDV